MFEIIVMIVAPILLSLAVMIYNNFPDIKEKSGFSARLKEVFAFKKNKIVLLLLTLFGIGIMFLSHWTYEYSLEISLKQLFIYELLIAVAYLDYKKMIIPNKLVLLGFFSYFVFFAYEAIVKDINISVLLKSAGLGLLFGGGVFALSGILSKGSMGMGDVKLFSVLGILMGFQAVFNVIFFSVLLVVIYTVIQFARKKIDRKSTVPVGPFALMGMMVSMVLGIGGMM